MLRVQEAIRDHIHTCYESPADQRKKKESPADMGANYSVHRLRKVQFSTHAPGRSKRRIIIRRRGELASRDRQCQDVTRAPIQFPSESPLVRPSVLNSHLAPSMPGDDVGRGYFFNHMHVVVPFHSIRFVRTKKNVAPFGNMRIISKSSRELYFKYQTLYVTFVRVSVCAVRMSISKISW
jgi:hypothetical protein